jgi:membrane protease YdiL (CAAX protease family)
MKVFMIAKIIAVLRIVGVFIGALLVSTLLGKLMDLFISQSFRDKYIWRVVSYLVMSTAMLLYHILVIRTLGKKDNARTGLAISKLSFKHLFYGLGLGTICIVVIWALIFLFGGYSVSVNILDGNMLYAVLILAMQMMLVGFNEEIISRGFMAFAGFKGGRLFSAIFISIVFSLMHGAQSVNAFSIINLFMFSIVSFQLTWIFGSLWPAIGFHASWNFIIGGIFGVSISGVIPIGSVFVSESIGAYYLNGGWHGLEGSFICTILLVILALFLWRFFIKRGIINHSPTAEWLS